MLQAAFITYSKQFTRPINDIANLYSTIQSAQAGAERIFELMDETPEPSGRPGLARQQSSTCSCVFMIRSTTRSILMALIYVT